MPKMFDSLQTAVEDLDIFIDADDDYDAVETDLEIQEAEAELSALEDLDKTISDLDNLSGAIEKYGISPSLVAFADKGGLLSSAALLPSLESVGTESYGSDHTESVAAMESIGEKIKEMAAAFIGKISAAGQKVYSAVMGFFKGIYTKVSGMLGRSSKAEETTTELKAGVTYGIAAAAVAALVMLPGAIATVVSVKAGMGKTTLEATKIVLKGALGKIGKIPGATLSLARSGAVKVGKAAVETKTATLKALGWSKSKLVDILKKCADAFRPGGILAKAAATTLNWIKSLVGSVQTGAKAVGSAVKTGSGKVAAGAKAVGETLSQKFSIWRASVGISLRFCWSMLRSVAGSIWSMITRAVSSVSAGFKGFTSGVKGGASAAA
jgi:hypothetical protein